MQQIREITPRQIKRFTLLVGSALVVGWALGSMASSVFSA